MLLVGFALQRFLIDILTGFFMQFEGWYAVGDSVIIEPWALAGVVEEISLRSTRLRSITGEVVRVHNGRSARSACYRAAPARSASSCSSATRPRGAGCWATRPG